MAKGQDSKKAVKKTATKSLKEKRNEKKQKKLKTKTFSYSIFPEMESI